MRKTIIAVFVSALALASDKLPDVAPSWPPLPMLDSRQNDPAQCEQGEFYRNIRLQKLRSCYKKSKWATVTDNKGHLTLQEVPAVPVPIPLSAEMENTILRMQKQIDRAWHFSQQKTAELERFTRQVTPEGYEMREDPATVGLLFAPLPVPAPGTAVPPVH